MEKIPWVGNTRREWSSVFFFLSEVLVLSWVIMAVLLPWWRASQTAQQGPNTWYTRGFGVCLQQKWWELGRWIHRCMCVSAHRAAVSVCSQAAQIWCLMHSWVVLFLPRKCPQYVYPAFRAKPGVCVKTHLFCAVLGFDAFHSLALLVVHV